MRQAQAPRAGGKSRSPCQKDTKRETARGAHPRPFSYARHACEKEAKGNNQFAEEKDRTVIGRCWCKSRKILTSVFSSDGDAIMQRCCDNRKNS